MTKQGKKLCRLFRTDLYRTFMQPGFVLAVLAYCALCFTSFGYTSNTGSYTIMELLLNFSAEDITRKLATDSFHLFRSGVQGSYTVMFAPMIAAITAVPSYCRERITGALRFLLPRCGGTLRCLSYQLSAMVTGGTIVTLGSALFGLCCLLLFPGPTAEMAAMETAPCWLRTVKVLVGMFFFGMNAALLPVLLTACTKNVYVALCLGFTGFYAYNALIGNRITQKMLTEDYAALERLNQIYPSRAVYLADQLAAGQWGMLLFWLGIALFTFGVLRLSYALRLDRGV